MKLRKLIIVGLTASALFLTGCSVEQTKETKLPTVTATADPGSLPEVEVKGGKMPSADVDAKGGQLPEIEVKTADVDVKTKTIEVEVPDGVEVTMPKDQK